MGLSSALQPTMPQIVEQSSGSMNSMPKCRCGRLRMGQSSATCGSVSSFPGDLCITPYQNCDRLQRRERTLGLFGLSSVRGILRDAPLSRHGPVDQRSLPEPISGRAPEPTPQGPGAAGLPTHRYGNAGKRTCPLDRGPFAWRSRYDREYDREYDVRNPICPIVLSPGTKPRRGVRRPRTAGMLRFECQCLSGSNTEMRRR